jgi:hypothetical protein
MDIATSILGGLMALGLPVGLVLLVRSAVRKLSKRIVPAAERVINVKPRQNPNPNANRKKKRR